MDDDELLRKLGTLSARQDDDRDRDRDAAQWERLLRGELSASEVAELERLAERDEEAAMMLSLHRPLEASVREGIVSDLAAHVTSDRAPAPAPTRAPAPARSEPTRLSAWRARAYTVGAGVALAAGVALLVTRGGTPAALPLYTLDVSGAATSRGPSPEPAAGTLAAACVLHANPRSTFELVARTDVPGTTGAGPIAAHAFVVRAGATTPWSGALEISPSGSVRILDSAALLQGASELRVVVGRKEQLAGDEALAKARGTARSGPGWQVLGCAVVPAAD